MSRSISIVLAIHDLEDREYTRRLEYCLTSLLIYQSMKPVEVIITDSSPRVSLARKKIALDIGAMYITMQRDSLVLGELWNTGISKASGEYIGVTSPDMIFSPHFFEHARKHIIRKKDRVFIIGADVRHLPKDKVQTPSKWELMSLNSSHTEGAIGIQLAHRMWWETSGGYNEDAIMHGIDTGIYQKARQDGLRICRVRQPIFHQWHPTSKLKFARRES